MSEPLTEEIKVRVSKTTKQKLERAADRIGANAPVSIVIRQAIERFLAAEERRKK